MTILAGAQWVSACLRFGLLVLAASGTALLAPRASAQAADTGGAVTAEAGKVTTRRQVLDRLFADRDIQVEWRDESYADEAVQNRYSKATDSAARRRYARRLLSRSNYIIVYDTSGKGRRMSRVVVLGPSPPPEKDARTLRRHAVSIQAQRQRQAAQRRAAAARQQRAAEAARRRQAIARSRRGH